jgi:hypothetical protein
LYEQITNLKTDIVEIEISVVTGATDLLAQVASLQSEKALLESCSTA